MGALYILHIVLFKIYQVVKRISRDHPTTRSAFNISFSDQIRLDDILYRIPLLRQSRRLRLDPDRRATKFLKNTQQILMVHLVKTFIVNLKFLERNVGSIIVDFLRFGDQSKILDPS